MYIVENEPWSLIPRAAYGYKISAALLNASEDICVFIVYMLVVFVFINSFVQVLSAMYYLLITHVSIIYFMFNNYKR